MIRIPTITALVLTLSCLSVSASQVFEATQAFTMLGKQNAADRFGQVDFRDFEAGCGPMGEDRYENNYDLTRKGFAYFDLEKNGLREALQNEDGNHALLSFVLLQVVGKPRPLRVEYIGTTNDKDSNQSRAAQFQAQPLRRANDVLHRNAEPGLKVVDVTGIIEHTLSRRWLILRFEQEGFRIEDGLADQYQFNPNTSTVRLTLTKDKKDLSKALNHYDADGLGGILPDMHENILPDMSTNILPDMPKNLTPGLKDDILPDMNKENILPDMNKENILPDMNTQNIIQDQNN